MRYLYGMRLKTVICVAAFTGLCVLACGQAASTTQMMMDLSVLSADSLEGRGIDTPGSAKARDYLAMRLEEEGVLQFPEGWFQPFSVIHPIKRKKLNGQNIMGWVRGTEYPDQYIVLSSHYDHLGIIDGEIYNGADDNASGTSALLEIAHRLQQQPPKFSVILVAFDGEETGLIGSKHFVANPPVPKEALVLNINLDMIGRNVSDEIYLCGKTHYPEMFESLANLEELTSLKVSFGHDGKDGKDDWTYASDHANFHLAGIPIIYFGEEDHPDYHMASDEINGIQPSFYTEVVNLVMMTLTKMQTWLAEQ